MTSERAMVQIRTLAFTSERKSSHSTAMSRVAVALLVFVLTLGAALVARRLRTPLPATLAAAGIVLGALWRFAPWLPPVSVPPDYVLCIFLPPLLATAAYSLPLAAFRGNQGPITLPAVGLVSATMGSVAVAARTLGAMSWGAAFVLGAIVAPPDPVAATSVAGRTGLSHRLVAILEGEGLVNDAVAITASGLAVGAAASHEFGWGETESRCSACRGPAARDAIISGGGAAGRASVPRW